MQDVHTVRDAAPSAPDYEHIRSSEAFTRLRSRHRWFVFPMSLAFLAWYMAYVLLAAYAHDFMSTRVVGEVNVAMVLGILQFVSTALVTILYVRFGREKLDPAVTEIRRQAGVADAGVADE